MLVLPAIWGVCVLGFCCDGGICCMLAILKYYSGASHGITTEDNTRGAAWRFRFTGFRVLLAKIGRFWILWFRRMSIETRQEK